MKIVASGLGKSPGTAHAPVIRQGVAPNSNDDRFRGPHVPAEADRRLVEVDQDVQPDQTDRDVRNGRAGNVVLEGNHQRAVGWSTTIVGRVKYRSAARATSSTVTASIARA